MSWVRLDDGFAQHPKVLQVGPLGMAMQVAGICYASRNLTDGFVPRAAAATLLCLEGLGMRMWSGEMFGGGDDARWELVVEDLVNSGMWEPVDGGWRIHDYLDFQPSKKDVIDRRNETRKRVRHWRNDTENRRNAVTNNNCNAVTNSVSNTTPDPDPDPGSEKTSLISEKRESAKRLIAAFNRITGKKARETETNIRAFEARLADTSESDIEKTLLHRYRKWSQGDGRMLEHFVIETLTRPAKFEKYYTEYVTDRDRNTAGAPRALWRPEAVAASDPPPETAEALAVLKGETP